MNYQFQQELAFVKKVLQSCETNEQKENAKRWAQEWARRQKYLFKRNSQQWKDLYISVS